MRSRRTPGHDRRGICTGIAGLGESSTLTPHEYVGLELKVDRKNIGFVSSKELENGIRSLMEGEKERKVRQRAEEMKVSGRKAVEERGSYTSLELLVYQIIKNIAT
ncbi:UDP-glucuronosyl/UDP-glucosyltransferase protein [Dioscorea alata]|uniref:UDP-glucuronosyl/UDP-glucosyltransferase protein n=1 Tax=Dioscorea alata TaxID=55571 RepID=A0ACB7UHI9_DIOAL|nr:UDP-glucuronosyl/UDP-glucosyltransferase protein [Dioscorea alata]